jgi:3-oxoacyl-(acyl-carrier-protein) synthase
MHQRRVVITGLGVLAPNGCGKETFWQACLQGRSGIRPITRFATDGLQTRITGDIPDFSPEAFGVTPIEHTILGRGSQFGIAAANLALEDAGLNLHDSERESTGVYLGAAMASIEETQQLWEQLTDSGAHSVRVPTTGIMPATAVLSFMPAMIVASHHRLRGPCMTIATGCSAGGDAIGQAFWQIQEGRAERMLAGGTDAPLNLVGVSVFNVMHALSTRNDEPERASRPYDAQRDGFVLSEGAAVLLLEERELALARGAHIYAEIQSFVTNSNAYHMAALPKDGAPLQALLRQALEESHLAPEQLGYINSHGSSTQLNDGTETFAYKQVFGAQAYHIPISSTKSLIGHTQGAASAIEVAVTALALDQQVLPPTINQEVPDPECDLDYIPNVARPVDESQPLRFALTHSSGFGGVNTALVLARDGVLDEAYAASSESQASKQLSSVAITHLENVFTRPETVARRVVVTGLGAVAPNGIGKAAFWKAVCAGHSAIGPCEHYCDAHMPPRFVGEVKDFRVEDYVDRKLVSRTDRMTHLVLAAVQEALQDAKLVLEQEDPQRLGAVIANTIGGAEFVTQQVERLFQRGPHFMSAHTALAWLHVANVGRMSILYDLRGYGKVPVNDACGSLDAFGMAYQAIRRGKADVLIAGGTEAPLNPCVLHPLDLLPPLHGGANPYSYRPFDLRADGLLLAEGAGICILEEYEHALQRSAPIYGEIVGYAQTYAPGVLSADPHPDAVPYVRALQLALTEAHMSPEDIACVFPDGRAIPAWDAIETAALREVFGSTLDTLPCSVPRTQFGHSIAAAGALDTICALMALQEGLVPPTINCEEPDARYCPPGLVRGRTREQDVTPQGALVCARGLAGSHAVLAVKRDV